MIRFIVYSIVACLLIVKTGSSQNWQTLAPPVEGEKWVRPAQDKAAQPIWGHRDGMRVGLSPLPGPRGLIRIYTPYLGHRSDRIMNFLAMEPIVHGNKERSFSELEMSNLDDKRGKRFWSSNDSLQGGPQNVLFPASGKIEEIDGVETLTLFVFSEEFESGAKVYVRLRFFEDKPYEVEVVTYVSPDSAPLDYFVVTATMGNFARLRNLYLTNRVVSSHSLWPDYKRDAFTDHAHFAIRDFVRSSSGDAYFIAAPDETDPATAKYHPSTVSHWKYYGKKGVQYWKINGKEKDFEGLVNGRYTYWASKSPIPGGISFENFELKAPFHNGTKMVFGISPLSPESFIPRLKNEK